MKDKLRRVSLALFVAGGLNAGCVANNTERIQINLPPSPTAPPPEPTIPELVTRLRERGYLINGTEAIYGENSYTLNLSSCRDGRVYNQPEEGQTVIIYHEAHRRARGTTGFSVTRAVTDETGKEVFLTCSP